MMTSRTVCSVYLSMDSTCDARVFVSGIAGAFRILLHTTLGNAYYLASELGICTRQQLAFCRPFSMSCYISYLGRQYCDGLELLDSSSECVASVPSRSSRRKNASPVGGRGSSKGARLGHLGYPQHPRALSSLASLDRSSCHSIIFIIWHFYYFCSIYRSCCVL